MNRLRTASFLNLATYRRNGLAVETPVWFAELDDKLYVFSAGDAGKVKRLRNSSRARVAACDVRGRLRGEWIDASASIVAAPETIAAAHAAMRRKYGWQMWGTDLLSRLSGRIQRRAWLEIRLRAPAGSDEFQSRRDSDSLGGC